MMKLNKKRDRFGARSKYRPNGDYAKLPLELWRAPLWTPANQHTLAKAEERNFERHVKNSFGDIYHISANELLRPSPDMSVLLAIIALCQKKYAEDETVRTNSTGENNMDGMKFTVPITELYNVSGIPSRHRSRLVRSMSRLASVKLEIDRKIAINGNISAGMSFILRFEIIKRKVGEKCDSVLLTLHRALTPREKYIFRSSRECAMLKTDTARLLFWLMTARQHIRCSRADLYCALGTREIGENTMADAQTIMEWEAKRLRPALKELERIGWQIKRENSIYTIKNRAEKAYKHDIYPPRQGPYYPTRQDSLPETAS